jgi:glycosyltransferase involved in cell wall biosynthesis
MASLSVLVPVYNEQHLVAASLSRLEVLESSPELERVQVVVVDDSSRDRSPEVLAEFARERGIELAPRGSGRGSAGGGGAGEGGMGEAVRRRFGR